jgi:branched-chain amino acid transport system substrate-binding protein
MVKLRSTWLVGLLVLVALAFFFSPAGLQAAGKKEIVIGTPLPVTGVASQEGNEERWAYEQAVADINAKGGIFVKQYNKKLPVKLIVADIESDPGKGAGAVERLVKIDHVDLLLSSFAANFVMPTAIAAEKFKIYYHGNTCFPVVWRGAKLNWSTMFFFELDKGAEVPYKVLDTIPAAKRPTKFALLMEDTADGRAFGGGLAEAAKKYNWEIVLNEPLGVAAKDYSSQILKLKSKGVDGAILFAAGGDCVTFVRQMKEAGLNLKYLHGYKGTWNTDFWNALGKDANYILADGFWSENWGFPGGKELGERYFKKFHKRSVSIGLYYASCQILWEAIQKAGSVDSAKVKQAVMTNTFKGTTMGDVKYNPDGTAIFPLPGFQWWEGELKTVYPFERSGGWKVKVAPPWDKR